MTQKNRPKEATITYVDFINTFIEAGCIKFDKSTDNKDILIVKYR